MPAQFCGRCGIQRTSEGDLYCPACGRPYSEPAAPTYPPVSSTSPSDATVVQRTKTEQPATGVSATSSQQLKTGWLAFWTYVHLPLGVIVGTPVAFWRAHSAEELFGIILVEIPLVWLAITLVIGLHRRRLSAWQLNWLWLLIEVFNYPLTRLGEQPIADKTEAFAAFLGRAIVCGLIWGLPNYIYFKKRRALFSGPPLVEDGIRGIFRAIWRFIWPSVASLESAKKASREGLYAAVIITLVTLILVSFNALGYPLYGFRLWSLLDASMAGAIAWGIYRLSRTASALGILFLIVEEVDNWTKRAPQSLPDFIDSVVITSVLALMFVNGARGTFAYQRHQKATADKSRGPVPTSSVRWKIYSAVLASFVMGVLALRVYQSLTRSLSEK